jgi:PPK2 family polyphosphate:nucleotide phosphotransferase
VPDREVLSSAAELDQRLRVRGQLDLAEHDPGETFGMDKAATKAALATIVGDLHDLQRRLFAESSRSVLVVLQAMDAGGKDGVLRDVFTGLNPAGIRVTSFGVPNEEDLARDYLWRVHQHVPADGHIGVFNRSHYEDVLVVRVKGLASEEVWRRRYGHIVEFERILADEGTAIVKFFLNISAEEQRMRFQDRIDNEDERWKFRRGDLDDRARWNDYMAAYTEALERTSTDHAPWYVVPADRKWVRNHAVATVLRDVLQRLDPQYPPAEPGNEGIVVDAV